MPIAVEKSMITKKGGLCYSRGNQGNFRLGTHMRLDSQFGFCDRENEKKKM